MKKQTIGNALFFMAIASSCTNLHKEKEANREKSYPPTQGCFAGALC